MARDKQPSLRLRDHARNRLVRLRAIGQRSEPFDDIYHFILSRSWWQFFAMIAATYFVVNSLFACVYMLAPGSINQVRRGSFEDAFFFSVQTMTTIGYGVMSPATRFGNIMVSVEAITGTLAAALITGVTFARFARPTARVLFSDNAVIHPRDGVPHLLFRMANWRLNQIVEARLSVTLFVNETTREGDRLRRPRALKLVRDTTPLFSLSWVAMHTIDETSPFHGENALDQLRALDASLLVTLRGTDETFSTEVIARHTYQLDDLVPNARFVDVLSRDEDGTRVLDFTKFHEVEALSQTERLPV